MSNPVYTLAALSRGSFRPLDITETGTATHTTPGMVDVRETAATLVIAPASATLTTIVQTFFVM